MKFLKTTLLIFALIFLSTCESMIDSASDLQPINESGQFDFSTTKEVAVLLNVLDDQDNTQSDIYMVLYVNGTQIAEGVTSENGRFATKVVVPGYIDSITVKIKENQFSGTYQLPISGKRLEDEIILENTSPLNKNTVVVPNETTFEGYKFVFDGMTDNGDGTSTWTYTVTGMGAAKDLSHWVLGLCDDHRVLSVTGGDWDTGRDPRTGVDGVKFDESVGKNGEFRTFSFTLDGVYMTDVVEVAFKAGPNSYYSGILGPSCAPMTFNNITDGFLAYEDLWPEKGDYDFNDLVIDYTINQITNVDNEIVEIEIDLEVIAAGAKYNNAFGIEIPDLSMANIAHIRGEFFHETELPNTAESRNGNFVIIPFDHTQQFFSGNTHYINTRSYPPEATKKLSYTIALNTPMDISAFSSPPYNPFIIINSLTNGDEVHLVGNEGTFVSLPVDNPYTDENGMPWAIHIAGDFDYPIEKMDIRTVYNYFEEWANSGGELYSDWFLDKPGYREPDMTYTQED